MKNHLFSTGITQILRSLVSSRGKSVIGGKATHTIALATPANGNTPQGNAPSYDPQRYIGMWVTADGNIRQELRADGRYDEARGKRQSAYQGDYRISGDHINYRDDTGFTADGYFKDDVLYHAGMIMYRQSRSDAA